MIYLFLADGFEEIEALAVVDIIRRAELDIKIVGVNSKEICGAHNIRVITDMEIKDLTTDDMDMIILPGGMPGTLNLEKNIIVETAINYCFKNDKYVCAICAAPSILGHLGYLKGKNAVCFPGFEGELIGANNTDERVCVDGKIITAKAAGTAVEFALKIVEVLVGYPMANKIKQAIQSK